MPKRGSHAVTVYLSDVEQRWIRFFAEQDQQSASAVVRSFLRTAIRQRASAVVAPEARDGR